MDSSSISRRSATYSGTGSPYHSFAFAQQMSRSSCSAPGIVGLNVPGGIGVTCSIISAILFVFVTTTS